MGNIDFNKLFFEYYDYILFSFLILFLLEEYLTLSLKYPIFKFGITIFSNKMKYTLKTNFENNIIYKTNNYKFKFINSQICIFTRKLDFYEFSRYLSPLKGIMLFKNNELVIKFRLPFLFILSPFYIIFAFFNLSPPGEPFSMPTFFLFIIICLFIFYIIQGLRKTKKYMEDGINELVSTFNLKNINF